jgi:hypothetical protein
MNKTTKTALHAKTKSELVDFAWIMVKMYNESDRQRVYLESLIIKQKKLLDFALVKSGDTDAEQVA